MKKFKLIYVALMGMLIASCNQSDEQFENAKVGHIAPVTVRVAGFSVSHEEFSGAQTRAAQDVTDYTDVNAITLAFYKGDGTEAVKTTQLRTDGSTNIMQTSNG